MRKEETDSIRIWFPLIMDLGIAHFAIGLEAYIRDLINHLSHSLLFKILIMVFG
jgi:hypothetical protein